MAANDSTPARSGALTTRLNTALEHARDALRPHAGLAPGGSLTALDAMLAEFARRRVRIALYGEVKAGKSTLLNAIAGTTLSPVAFDPLTSIPVRITYGEETVWRLGDHTLSSSEELARAMREEEQAATEVVVETDLDLLQLGGQVDLIDTPGVGSEERFDTITNEVLRSLDAVVLVVRYPGLFTKATRRLMDGLQTDMGKLFVVWNLDQACSELTAAERTQHTETLRANVAGAHDLFLVDARAGLDATGRRDAAAIAGSGLGAFTAALGRFCSSSGRDLTAVREAAKRSKSFLGASRQALSERLAELKTAVRAAHDRLSAVKAKANSAADAERAKLEELEGKVGRLAEDFRAAADKLAADLRRKLVLARRAWIHSANATALAEAIATAAHDHADAADAASRETTARLQAEAKAFGTEVSLAARPRTAIAIGELAPEDRLQQSTSGNFQWVRRALWRRWYVPGVETLLSAPVSDESSAQTAWLDGVAAQVRTAASQTTQTRLQAIADRAQTDQDDISRETNLVANQAEHDALTANLPIVEREVEVIRQLAAEARSFL